MYPASAAIDRMCGVTGKGRNLAVAGEAGGVVAISRDGKQMASDRAGEPDGRYVAYYKVGFGIYRKAVTGPARRNYWFAPRIIRPPRLGRRIDEL